MALLYERGCDREVRRQSRAIQTIIDNAAHLAALHNCEVIVAAGDNLIIKGSDRELLTRIGRVAESQFGDLDLTFAWGIAEDLQTAHELLKERKGLSTQADIG